MGEINLFKYNFKRYFRNKNFLIMCGTAISLSFILNISIFLLVKIEIYAAQIALFANIPLAMILISFININGIVNIIIIDEKSGIQGLEIRRGVKLRDIFLYKTLALKILNWIYIFLIWILFLISVSFFRFANANYILTSLSIGFFSLFAYDIFIFGLTLSICLFSKSNKKTISFGWIFTIIFSFSLLIGPMGFAFTGGEQAFASDNRGYLVYNLKRQVKTDGFFSKIQSDYETLRSDYRENFKLPDSMTDKKTFNAFNYFFNISFSSGGLYLEFNNILNTNSTILTKYFENPSAITFDKEKILNRTEESLVYHFLEFFSQGVSGNNETNFSNSYYNKISITNIKKSNQLNDVLGTFTQKKWREFIEKDEVSTFGLTMDDFDELVLLNKTLKNVYFDDITIYNNNGIRPNNVDSDSFDFYSDSKNWVNEMKYSFGTHLYCLLFFKSIVDPTSSSTGPYASSDWNYKYNPFMWVHEMVYFSGKNDFVDDNKILTNSLLPLTSFRQFVLDENEEMIPKSRPFNVVLNYFIFIIPGVSLILISYAYFGKRIYSRAGLE